MEPDGKPPARRPAGRTAFSALNRFSLRSLLIGSAAVVALYCVLVVVALHVSQGRTIRMMDRLINVDAAIPDLCLRSTAAMSGARSLEKDFLLGRRTLGSAESEARYVTRLVDTVAQIRGNLERIRALSGDPDVARRTREVERALERYRRGVEALAARHRERGSPDAGIYAAMRAEAQAMERVFRSAGSGRLLGALLAARRAERYYVEREREAEAREVVRAVRGLAASASSLPAGPRREVERRAGEYLALFDRYVSITEEIRRIEAEHREAVGTIEPLLEALYAGSLERVAARRRAIERSSRILSLPVIVVGGAVLVLVTLLSLGIALGVSRGVVESKAFAEQIAAGDLQGRLAPGGRNEFFALATALNSMAQSLQEADAARRRGVEALRESEAKYRSLVEASSDWIWAADLEGRHTFTNDRVRTILGIEPEELLRLDLESLLHPEDAPKAAQLLRAARVAGTGWREVLPRWRHGDGSWRWIESSAEPVLDSGGAVVGFRGVDRDVTERRRLEEELVKAQKLEAIGTLAGGIAHDFNNLLQGLFGYLSLARVSLGRGEDPGELLEQAEKALALSVNLTTQLLTFAKGGAPLKRRIDLGSVLENPVKFALSGSRSGYRIRVEDGLWPVDADAGQLAQVIQNLVLNAGEAMAKGGTVEIDARRAVIPEGANPLVPAGGEFVRIDVGDTGAGIAGGHLPRIFDPYFTTKQKGSGLGLATSYSIVRNHGGFIDVTTRVGEGSVFSVYLPASPGPLSPAPRRVAGAGERTGRVLVMDDGALVRSVAERLLEALGHGVATASNGEEALELYRRAREEGNPFDVVVLDLTVKNGMGGEETVRRLLELDPAAKAVVSSGYSDASVLGDFRSHGFSARLGKPYRLEALRECLHELLAAPGTAAAGRG